MSAAKTLDGLAPRFATAWASLVYAVSTMLLAYPALGGSFLVNILSDQYKIGYAFREYAAASLRSGHGFPKWNPYLFGGLPYIAAMHGDIFYPTFLLRMVLPTDVAMTWEFPIHLFLAGLFTYGFLRAWGFGFASSLIGGLAYMLSGQVASLVSPGHDGKLFVSALFPAVLWLLVRGIRDGRAWTWGVLSIVVGLAILSPHPQLVQYMLLASGVFALYLAFAHHEDVGTLSRNVAIKRLAFALGSVLLGAAISAIQYWPVIEYVPFSPRAGGRGYDYATSFSMPIEEIFNTYLPQFSGILRNYWGRNNIHFHSEYIGAAVLVLMGAAFGPTARRSFRRFWIAVGAVALVWALGGDTPFYHIVYAIVPGTKFFRAPSTIFFVVSFAVAALAAVGVERIVRREVGTRYAIGWGAAALLIAILISVGAATPIMQVVTNTMANAYPQQHDAAATALMERATANSSSLILGAWRSFMVVAIAAGLIWGVAMDRVAPRLAVFAFVALVALDLWSIERLYWNFSKPAAQLYASDPAADYLAKQTDPGRVLVLQIPQVGGLEDQDPMLQGCSGGTGGPALMVHRIRNVTGCHGNELGRYQQLGAYTDTTPAYDSARLLSPAGARHQNIRFVETNVADSLIGVLAEQLKSGTLTHVLGPVKTAAGSTVYLYRLPGDNPLAWVAASMVKATSDQTLATVLSAGFDPGRAAILDTNATVPTVPVSAVPQAAAPARVSVAQYEPGAIDLTLDQPATAGQALVVSENYFPGWTAVADGKGAPVVRADFNLIGVALPAGARTIQLRFRDRAYEKGKMMSLFAIATAFVLWGLGLAVDKRRPAASVTA